MRNEFKTKLISNSVSLDHKIHHQFTKNKFKNRSHIVTYDQNNTIHTYKNHNGKVFFKTCGKNNFDNLDIKIQDTSESLYAHRQKITNKELNRISPTKVEIPSNNNCFGVYCNNLTCIRNFGTNSYHHDSSFIKDSSRFTLYNYVNYPYVHLIRNYNYGMFLTKPSTLYESSDFNRCYAINTLTNEVKPYNILRASISESTHNTVYSNILDLNTMALSQNIQAAALPASHFDNIESNYSSWYNNSYEIATFITSYGPNGPTASTVTRLTYQPYPWFKYKNSSSNNGLYPMLPIVPTMTNYNPSYGQFSNYKTNVKNFGDPEHDKFSDETAQTKCFLEYAYMSPFLKIENVTFPSLYIGTKFGINGDERYEYNLARWSNLNNTVYANDNYSGSYTSIFNQFLINNNPVLSRLNNVIIGWDQASGGKGIIARYRLKPILYSFELNNMTKNSKKYKDGNNYDPYNPLNTDFEYLVYNYYGYSESYNAVPNHFLYPCYTERSGGLEFNDLYVLNFDIRLEFLPTSSSKMYTPIGLICNKKERIFFKKYKRLFNEKMMFIGESVVDKRVHEMKELVNEGKLLIFNDVLKDFICSEERTYYDRYVSTDSADGVLW